MIADYRIAELFESCPHCHGEGGFPTDTEWQECQRCHGDGEVSVKRFVVKTPTGLKKASAERVLSDVVAHLRALERGRLP